MECPSAETKNPYFIIGGSVIGPSHVKASVPCQDASAFEIYSSRIAVLCVSDGAGSAKCAQIGAQTAVTTVLKEMSSEAYSWFQDEVGAQHVLREVFGSARRSVEQKSKELGCSLRDLASTLLVAILRDGCVAVGHVGDGGVVVTTSEGLLVLSPPEETEYSNETTFLTNENWEKFLRVSFLSSGALGVAVFTDGCQRAALMHSSKGWLAGDRFLGELFAYAKEICDPNEGTRDILHLLESDKVCENWDDDKSLLIAVMK